MKGHFVLLAMAILLLLATPWPAKAYLDPGTGSMVLQIAVGGMLALIATVRIYWRRLKSIVRPRRGAEGGNVMS